MIAISPERGAIVTRFDDVLFMDAATLADPTKNIRGGIPILFPSPGKLAGDRWMQGGQSGSMKQHGFARNLAWQPIGPNAFRLESNDVTRAQFPWDFTFDMTYVVEGSTLRLDHRITNRSRSAMPFGVGFHPYFKVRDADKPKTTITTKATRAFDNVTKRTIDLAGIGIDLAQKEVDLHLLDHGSTESTLAYPGGTIHLSGSKEYTHWVVWTLAGRDFVCLEPWTCPGDALNSGDRLIRLEPSETRELWFSMSSSR